VRDSLTSRGLRQTTAQAEAEFLGGYFGNAETLFGEAAKRAPKPEDRARARYWRGVCRLKQGRAEEAQRDFESYLGDPADSSLDFEAQEGLADSARELGQFGEAATRYESLAAATPPSSRKASLLGRLAECRSKAGDSVGAQQARRMAGKLERPPGPEEFIVQLGAFSKRASAEELVKRLRAKGFRGEVTSQPVEGRELHRVRSGRFSDKARAETHARKLKRIGFDAIVVP